MNSPLLSVRNGSYLNGPAHRSSRLKTFLAYASFSKMLDRQPLRLCKPTPRHGPRQHVRFEYSSHSHRPLMFGDSPPFGGGLTGGIDELAQFY
jgi:hypothetical protein